MKPFHVDFTGDIILRPDLHYLYNAAGLTVGILHPLPEGNIALWQTQRLRPAAGPIPASVLGLADGKQRILLMTACAGCLNRAMSLSSLLEPAGNYLRVIQQNLLHTKIDPRLRQLAEAAITKFNEVLSSRGDLVNSIADAAIKAIGMPATNEAINNIRSLIYEARAGSQTWTLSDNQKVAALGMAITLPVAHAAAFLLDLQTHERWILELGPDNSITPAKRRPTVAILAGASRSAPNSEGKVSFLAASEGRHDLEKVLPFTAIMVVQCAARAQDAAGDPNKVVAHMAYEAMDKICAEAMTAKDPGETATANIRDWWGSPLGACVDVRFVKLHDADLLASLGANRNQLYGDVFYAHFSSADVCEAIQRTGGLYLFSDTAYLRAVCLQSRPDGGAATPEMMDLLEEIGIQIELLDPLLSDTGVNELGARVAQQLEQGMKALFPDIAQHDHLTNRIGLYTTFGTVQSLTTLDRDNPVEFLFARKGGKLAPIIDLQPAAWQANDRQLFHLSDSRLYLLPCNALSAAAILICINGGRNLASTMLWPELNRGRVYLTDAALDYQYKLNTGSADELWEHPCAHLGLAAGLALTGQAGAGMVPDFVGAKPIHAARAKTAVRHQLQAADAPEPLPMPGLQLNLGESGPVLDAKTVEAAAEDEMEEMDLASLLFTMPSPKRQRGADAAA